MAESVIKKDYPILSKKVSLAGVNINQPDSGWYYQFVSLGLPSGATAIGLSVTSFDACVDYLLVENSLALKSPTQKTMSSIRQVTVFYTYL